MRKKALACLMAALSLFSMNACTNSSESASLLNSKKDIGDYKVWTTSATEKICQNVNYTEEETAETALSIAMCRNELEGAQIIITADEEKDIEEYTVSVSSLVSGTNVIPKENISVYNEKYIEILHKYNSNKEFPVNTFVPDALLPFDVAVEYGENTVKAGENQGIYVEVETESYMAPGNYRGTVTLNLSGKNVYVPINVTVYDFVINETGTTMNYCATYGRDSYATLELDGSDEMATAYFEKWLDYRMCCDLPYAGKGGPERYVELLRKYYNAEGFSTYRFYYNTVPGGESSYKGIPTNRVDAEEMKAHLKAVAKASVEDGVNYLDKAIFYYSNWIDEPNWDGAFTNVYNCHAYHNLILSEVEAELRQELIADENYDYYLDVVAETLTSIPIILPEIDVESKSKIDGLWGDEALGSDNFVHCPVIQLLGGEETRDYYATDADGYWSYTCVQPVYPYPSNHLDDYLVGWRALFWMQKAYGFDGYLNWAFCNYITDNSYTHMANPYEDDIRGYYPGDGFMFYPGAPYGIYGPVASLRCVAFRDGMEEYEYLTVAEDLYAKASVDRESILNGMYNRLFNASIPTTSSDVLMDTKTQLCEMIENASGDFGMIIDNTAMNGTKATVTFVMNNPETEVYYGEEKLTAQDGKYAVTLNLVENNYLELTLKYKGVEKQIRTRVAGELSIISVETQSDLNVFGVKPESDVLLNNDARFVVNDSASAKFVLRGKYYGVGQESQTYGYEPFIRLNTSAFDDLMKVENVYMNVYNASDKPITVSVTYYTNSNNHIADVVLQPGWNNLTLQNGYAFDNIQDAKYFFLRTANLLGADGKTELSVELYIDDIVYSKI